jgi:hypothetical protein
MLQLAGAIVANDPGNVGCVGAISAIPGVPARIAGVALTNFDDASPGWLVMGNDKLMMVQREAALFGTAPVQGAPVYLSGSEMTTFAWAPPSGAAYPLGRIAPMGPVSTTGPCAVLWDYKTPRSQAIQRASDLVITSSTTLVEFASLDVTGGLPYLIEAELIFNANASGGVDFAWAASGGVGLGEISGELFAQTPAVSLVDVQTAMSVGSGRLGASGPTNGIARIRGIFTPATDGSVSIQASQHASNASATRVYSTSWLRVTEQ